jgi:hypothetical protein
VDAQRTTFLPKGQKAGKLEQYYIRWAIIQPQTQSIADAMAKISVEYHWHAKIFSEQDSQWLPAHSVWDHAIKLLPGTPSTLPRRLLLLTQEEIMECHKFIEEHLCRGTIRESKSPYTTNFFFIKKKDGKLHPI